MASNELRLFVSSTFRDLQPEREQLVKKVFPRIRKECRERGVEFTEIDLRWGITEEESRSGRTVRICLEEIDRCRPYFIGIIGSRYGWIPGITEIEKDPEMLKDFPWLAEYAASEKSIIEMEFAHGAVLQKNDSAFFYEQKKKDSKDSRDFNDTTFASIGSLESLKMGILAAGFPYSRFTTPEELGEQVFSDILTILDRDFPIKKDLTPLERERIEHEAFARNRRQSYVANPDYYDAFVKHVESDGPPLIIWGPSGLGKSALMAFLAHEYQTRNTDAFVVQHFIGAAENTTFADVIRHILLEIKERFQIPDEVPTEEDKLRDEFSAWLAKAGGKDEGGRMKDEGREISSDLPSSFIPHPSSLILLIDALNQLTGIGPEMHWLPEFLPANVRLVVSTTPELPLDELRKRNWNELELKPLLPEQVGKIAENFLGQYRKLLTKEQSVMIASEEKSRRPLFLRTVLEEARVFGSHSELGEQLKRYLACADERELFQRVLERMEADHGAEAMHAVMSAIWAAKNGLSETEIMGVTGLPRMKLSELLIAMEFHLLKREELYTFFHSYLREGVQIRYVATEEEQKAAHAKLGEYFSTLEYGRRRRDEELWQWKSADDKNNMRALLLDENMLKLLFEAKREPELFQSWSRLEGFYDPAIEYGNTLKGIQDPHRIGILCEALIAAGQYGAASNALRERMGMFAKEELRAPALLDLRKMLGDALIHDSQFLEAATVYRELERDIPEGSSRIDKIELLFSISTLLYSSGDLEDAKKTIEQCIALTLARFGREDLRTAQGQSILAPILFAQGERARARALMREVVEIYAKLEGAESVEYARRVHNMAAMLLEERKLEEAEAAIETSLRIFTERLGEKHPLTLEAITAKGTFYYYGNRLEEAREERMKLCRLSKEQYGPDHPQTLLAICMIARSEMALQHYGRALELYERAVPKLSATMGSANATVIAAEASLEEARKKAQNKMPLDERGIPE